MLDDESKANGYARSPAARSSRSPELPSRVVDPIDL
jgi:hypothetical protein